MNKSEVSQIGRKDVIWNYLATFFQIGAGLILLPFILKMLPSESVGIWSIFTTITSFTFLLDFGFSPSFTRNITYIFSGVNELKKDGILEVESFNGVNYSLLKGVIYAMRYFYTIISLILLALLLSIGTKYFITVIADYSGDRVDAIIAWFVLCLLNAYNLYTQYYDSLLIGKGLIKVSKQIRVVGQIVYLVIALLLILLGHGLVAIVSAQAISIVIKRILSYKVFFTIEMKSMLNGVKSVNKKKIIGAIYPNAVKLGISSIGGLLITQSAVIIGSTFLSLNDIASYGITNQVVLTISSLAAVYFQSFIPKISEYRIQSNYDMLKKKYISGLLMMILVFLLSGVAFVLFGGPILSFIKSETHLLPSSMIIVLLFFAFLEKNNSLASSFLLANNEVPFYKASFLSGVATVILLYLSLGVFNMGLWGLILAPGFVQMTYQYWKWPLMAVKQLFFKNEN